MHKNLTLILNVHPDGKGRVINCMLRCYTKQLDSYRNIMDEDDDGSSASDELLQSWANMKITSVQDVYEM